MNAALRRDADVILRSSLNAVLPDEAVRRALRDLRPGKGRVLLVAAGKAAWQMAHAAVETLGRVDGGVVVTKYGHVKGEIPGVTCYEAGHPVPDANGFAATQKALELVQGLTAGDTVLFLLSGGGSALFEQPLVPGAELQDITSQLLASGADIVEMNTIRKRLSGVKGGRFAQRCAPAQVFSIVLSDILEDPLDMIASGPAVPDTSTCAQALAVTEKYHLTLSAQAQALLAAQQAQIDKLVGLRSQIIEDLRDNLSNVGQRVTVDRKTGAVTFESSVLFDTGKNEIKDAGKAALNSCIPVYIHTLLSDEYRDYVGEIIVEGHTDTTGQYLNNLALSQQRALAVATYCLSDEMTGLSDADKETFKSILTANGRADADPIYNADGTVNMDASRRSA